MNFPVQLSKSCHQMSQHLVCDNVNNTYSYPECTTTDLCSYGQVDEKRPVVMDLSTRRDYAMLSTTCSTTKVLPYQLPLRSGQPAKPLAYCTPNPVPNVPENNQVHLLEYRGAQLAAFTVEGRDLVCLPQAFELFLKHLVGGLHTVYTKLKRLEIIPVVCNVEQVRILRGLGAIQPGVNRCKLIAPHEFDILYADCTSSSARPGRPSKRIVNVSTPSNTCTLSSPSLSAPAGTNGHFINEEPMVKMLRKSLGHDLEFPGKLTPWSRSSISFSPGTPVIQPPMSSQCNPIGRGDSLGGDNSLASLMSQAIGRNMLSGGAGSNLEAFNTGLHTSQSLPNGTLKHHADFEAMTRFLHAFCYEDLNSPTNKNRMFSSLQLSASRSNFSQLPQSTNRIAAHRNKLDPNDRCPPGEWNNLSHLYPQTSAHAELEHSLSGLPQPPRNLVASSVSRSPLLFSAINLIEQDPSCQELSSRAKKKNGAEEPCQNDTPNPSSNFFTHTKKTTEQSPSSDIDSRSNEENGDEEKVHHSRLNKSGNNEAKNELEVQSYFDTIFHHLLEVCNQWATFKSSQYTTKGNDVSTAPRSTESPHGADQRTTMQCKTSNWSTCNTNTIPLRSSGDWFRQNPSSEANGWIQDSQTSEQNDPMTLSLREIMKPDSHALNQVDDGHTITPESDEIAFQTALSSRSTQAANYYHYWLQLMAKSFMSRYLHASQNENRSDSMELCTMDSNKSANGE